MCCYGLHHLGMAVGGTELARRVHTVCAVPLHHRRGCVILQASYAASMHHGTTRHPGCVVRWGTLEASCTTSKQPPLTRSGGYNLDMTAVPIDSCKDTAPVDNRCDAGSLARCGLTGALRPLTVYQRTQRAMTYPVCPRSPGDAAHNAPGVTQTPATQHTTHSV